MEDEKIACKKIVQASKTCNRLFRHTRFNPNIRCTTYRCIHLKLYTVILEILMVINNSWLKETAKVKKFKI